MKYLFSLLLTTIFCLQSWAQNTYRITYQRSYNDQVSPNQDPLLVYTNPEQTVISSEKIVQSEAKYPYETFYVERRGNLYHRLTSFSATKELATVDATILDRNTYTFSDETKVILGHTCKKATTSVNSNTIELWYTDELGVKGAPTELGQNLGLVLEYVRNGNTKITANKIEPIDHIPTHVALRSFEKTVDAVAYQDAVWKSRFIHIPVFQDEQINFVETPKQDSVLRFAHGTVILKKVKIPVLNKGSQAFIQLIEKSNGDAYDRTGSIFMIADDQPQTFLDGMKNGMNTLPMYTNGDGDEYPGMVRTDSFSPVYELMRFFTPFGVSHFNERANLMGKTWQDSVIYRQDVSEFLSVMSGKEVYIGTYIGNYDGGGHKVSVELTIHPGYSKMGFQKVMSIFNSTNVMEMGGQTYARFFSQEKGLEVTFELPEDAKDVQLRYITTGHGGWGNGDEFVPKENSIFLNGELAFKFTPWRTDCGSYRLYNPVSGNFQNGLSSSDLSRSNWCPATITNPNYISLGDLKAGKHTIRVHIPQGEPEGSSFSFWNVSGALIYN
ncbi:PNGase F N-terminal domain-containing protein [Sphingobacterium wenxiniae]|uniref:GLPGLI family protein n=1 Tax=Sphingobacterium wenxiniae TaxID=683125 RepID=A0A1I6Q4P7_9SPHI|nr:PNGase F N-terminal domain-containing protein [Sphingobacterium wenxiniae]SFS47459.1 GLPGLI family protein [Sphingobacterium wenxiniae]